MGLFLQQTPVCRLDAQQDDHDGFPFGFISLERQADDSHPVHRLLDRSIWDCGAARSALMSPSVVHHCLASAGDGA
jgi:hypothetical protein